MATTKQVESVSVGIGNACQKIEFEMWLLKDQLKTIKKFIKEVERDGGLCRYEQDTLSGMGESMSSHWINLNRELGSVRKMIDGLVD